MDQAVVSASPPRPWAVPAAIAAIAVALAATLTAFGQRWWCKCGSWNPVSFDTWSMHNSQHLFDAYSFSHVLHGFGFYGILALAAKRLSVGWRVVIALAAEAGWEILENTPMVIQRYRDTTVSLDYSGDSVLNSVSDLACCGLGFWIAAKLPWWATVGLFVLVELVLLAWIRDNLTLNILMLLYPIQAIKDWQAA